MDNLSYSYYSGSNQLRRVSDAGLNSSYSTDIDNQALTDNYLYNKNGWMTEDNAGDFDYTYYSNGLVKEIYKDDVLLLKYFYDEMWNCIRKEDYSNDVITYYLRDTEGRMLSVYQKQGTSQITQTEMPVYGNTRYGVFYRSGPMVYEISDHLGNVRVTFAEVSGNLEVFSYADYDPWGMEMPGRCGFSQAYRYGYQGLYAEKESSTGLNVFQLRQYDSRIGRWLSKDPFQQGYSPYIGMANNPVSLVDPTGGYVEHTWANYNRWLEGLHDDDIAAAAEQFRQETQAYQNAMDHVSSSLASDILFQKYMQYITHCEQLAQMQNNPPIEINIELLVLFMRIANPDVSQNVGRQIQEEFFRSITFFNPVTMQATSSVLDIYIDYDTFNGLDPGWTGTFQSLCTAAAAAATTNPNNITTNSINGISLGTTTDGFGNSFGNVGAQSNHGLIYELDSDNPNWPNSVPSDFRNRMYFRRTVLNPNGGVLYFWYSLPRRLDNPSCPESDWKILNTGALVW